MMNISQALEEVHAAISHLDALVDEVVDGDPEFAEGLWLDIREEWGRLGAMLDAVGGDR